ncbi:MAG: UbiA family prenyltransferase [Geminicoccaceae bacterium]|nr:MAG: UbiA family prenyltransferase [Geminicoccaceae bacterium]
MMDDPQATDRNGRRSASTPDADVTERASEQRHAIDHPVPLCVDLDGSLLVTDSLHEGLLAALVRQPQPTLAALRALPRGKAAFKRRIAELAGLDPALLPYNEELLTYLRAAKAQGRKLALFSAADHAVVMAIAAHLGIFDHAQGSDGTTNLSGANKLAAIRARYGDDFAYVGNTTVDLPIWQAARGAVVVNNDRRFRAKVETMVPIEAHFEAPSGGLRAWRKQMRLHQWTKNALIFVPIILAGPLAEPADLAFAMVGFLLLGLLASVGYVINDLLDLPADRRHRTKRDRPFAAGTLQAKDGVVVAGGMLLTAMVAALFLGTGFALAAAGYFVGTVSYSLVLKRVPMLDVLILAGLFTVRVVAGTTLTSAPFSFWLITFSIFLFMSLALVKRYAELIDQPPGDDAMLDSRGYSATDLPLLLPFGAGSALAAGLIFVVYLVLERFPLDVYGNPVWLWFVFPILMFWLMRIWRLAVHGHMDQDPVLFALKDRLSLALGGLVLLLVLLAW